MMRRMRRAGALVALSSLSVANACYAYLPIEEGAAPRDRVRVGLTTDGTRELARYLGPGVRVVEGTITRLDSTRTITLAVDFVHLNSGVRMPYSGEGMVDFPVAMREGVSRHTFMKRQTIVASGALAAAIIGTAILALRQGNAGSDGTGGPPPPPP